MILFFKTLLLFILKGTFIGCYSDTTTKNADAVPLQDQMSSCTRSYITPLNPMQILLTMMMKKKGCALRTKINVLDQNTVQLLLPLVYCLNC